jgi:N-glycosylase/DNA lyase
LVERAFAARGGVLSKLSALLLPHDVIRISEPINISFGALSILRDKKERVKAMDVAARLAIISYQIQDIENNWKCPYPTVTRPTGL